MKDYAEIDLMPITIKKQMNAIKKVGTCAGVCSFIILVSLWTFFFRDIFTGMVVSIVIIYFTIVLLLPSLMFDKVSQSRVYFSATHIHFLDKKGECWRKIDYNVITDVRVEVISDFFYGGNKDTFRNQYICVFLNGLTNIPNVSFAKLFTEKDFIMFGYHEETLHWLVDKCLNS